MIFVRLCLKLDGTFSRFRIIADTLETTIALQFCTLVLGLLSETDPPETAPIARQSTQKRKKNLISFNIVFPVWLILKL